MNLNLRINHAESRPQKSIKRLQGLEVSGFLVKHSLATSAAPKP